MSDDVVEAQLAEVEFPILAACMREQWRALKALATLDGYQAQNHRAQAAERLFRMAEKLRDIGGINKTPAYQMLENLALYEQLKMGLLRDDGDAEWDRRAWELVQEFDASIGRQWESLDEWRTTMRKRENEGEGTHD